MGISRDKWHKRSATGGRVPQTRKKRKFELGRPPALTKLGTRRVSYVRTRGGNIKPRALRLEGGNFAWASEGVTRKCRIRQVVYNASNNELVRTNTLVKGAILEIDAAPFKQWYLAHYGVQVGKKTETEAKKSKNQIHNQKVRAATRTLDVKLEELFSGGVLYARIASRPGQVGRVDGYILEGKELEFYQRKMK